MKKAGLMIFAFLLISFFVLAEDKIVYLTSLDWPPYTGEKIASQGASVLVAQKAFEAMGYEVRVDFFPWLRAVKTAKENDKYLGYFPEYYSQDIEKDFIFSEPMGEGPIGLVERKDTPIKWDTLQDIKKYTIGIVSGYVNSEQFDKMVAEKQIKTEAVVDDITNIKKVAAKRIPAAIIDKNVLEYYLSTNVSLVNYKKDLQFNSKILENKKIFICFKKSAKGEEYSKIFNEGLKKIDVNKIMKDYFEIDKK